MCKALSSNPSTAGRKEGMNERRKEEKKEIVASE
jgi:hypothetical protein